MGDRLSSSSSPDLPSASLPAPAPYDSTALLPPFSPPSPSPSSDGEGGPTRRSSRTSTGPRRDTREREREGQGRGWEQLQHYVDATMDLAHHAFPGQSQPFDVDLEMYPSFSVSMILLHPPRLPSCL